MTKGKTKKILLSLLLCGCFTNYAQAAETYPTYTVTTETKTVTYTDADGNEQTYSYETKVATEKDATFTNTYDTEAGTAIGTKYYAWTDDGSGNKVFTAVESSTAADITVTYAENTAYSTGLYNDGTDSSINRQSITADFVEDTHGYEGGTDNIGGAIENCAVSVDATLGTITGNFIGDSENIAGSSFGGAIANRASGQERTAEITAINGNFIGNSLTTATSGSAIAGGGAIANDADGASSTAEIGDITGDFIGNFVTDDDGSGSSGIAGGAIYNRADGTGSQANIGAITGSFIGNYAETTSVSAEGGAIYSDATANTSVSIGDITGDFIGNYVSSYGQGAAGAVFNRTYGTGASASIGEIEGTFTENYAKSANAAGMGGAIVNYAQRVTANDTDEKAEITAITGDFIGNYADGATSAYGGAIYNSAASAGSTAEIGDITAVANGFIGNYATAGSTQAQGGAIYNVTGSSAAGSYTTIGTVTADFINNYAYCGSGNVYGGAVFNYSANATGTAEIKGFSGDFIGNYVSSGSSGVYGGAIANYGNAGTAEIDSIEGSFIGNYATTSGAVYGGAIYNRAGTGYTAEITSIKGDFIENYAESTGSSASYGGAIVNYNAGITGITGSFVGNYAKSAGSSAYGGAIANRSGNAKIYSITGDFIGNYAKSDTASAYGGAILNFDGSAEIGTITGSFTGNYVDAATTAGGGAIYNQSVTMGDITGDFLGNYVTGNAALGGAIYNTGTIGSVTGDFIGNYAVSTEGNASGGAIYNTGTIGSVTGDFIGNYAVSTEGNAYGGAIYNTEAITEGLILGDLISNYAQGATSAKGGAVYDTVNTDVTINGDASGNYVKVTEEGDVAGSVIYLAQAESGATSITVNGDVTGNGAETASGTAKGGAFYNNENGTLSISGDISGNYAVSEDGVAYGGAIYNEGTMNGGGELKVGNLTNNYAQGTTDAKGGAIYDTVNTVVTIDGNASGNYVKVTEKGDVAGGVIYLAQAEEGETSITVNGDVTGNGAETASGTAKGGAFYNNENGTLSISGDISGNYAVSEDGVAYGGAIYNEGTMNGGGELKVGNLTNNYAQGTTDAKGGAIYDTVSTSVTIDGNASGNYVKVTEKGDVAGGVLYLEQADENATTVTVTGDVTGNGAETASGTAKGGAFYNNENGTLSISGDISGNYAVSEDGVAYGGAIYNEGTMNGGGELKVGNLTNNYAQGTTDAKGGAIYDTVSTSVTIDGNASGNYVKVTGEGSVAGGVLYLEQADENATTVTVTGDVTGNHAETESGTAIGGAFYNNELGTLTIEGGEISGNYVSGTEYAAGGAIYNEGTLIITAESLNGNYAVSSAGAALAGAIYTDSEDSVINVTGNVTGNYVKAEAGEATGGAIHSLGTTTIEGDVTNNYAEGADAEGGAIFAGENSTVNLYGDITGNYAKGDTAKGGAIYNADGATVNIYVEDRDAVISGNYVESGGTQEANVLYGEAGSVTNFNLTDATLRLDDSLQGDTGYEVNVAGNGIDATTFYMYNDILDSNLSIGGTTLNTINNEVHTYSVNKFTVTGDFNMVADVDLANETMDRFVTNGNNYGDAKGSLNVSGMNLISDTTADRVGIYFAEPGLKENVTSSVGQLPGSEQQTAYTPLYQYNVSYDKNYDGSWGDDGGYFVFDKQGNNPAAMMPTIAQMGLFNAMNMMFEYCFEHSDYYMKLPSETRLAIREKAKAARAEKLAAKNGTTVEEETQKIDDARAEEMASREGDKFYDHDNVLPLYDQHELTRPGAWVKTFATKESIPFTGKFTARDKYYGGIIGVDTDFREDRKGWGNVFTGYAGYQGIHQSYSGGSIRQDGGLLGATETFYKKNFYTAWTIAAASTTAKGRNMYGHESSRLYTYGIATKSGWNLEYDGGKYIVLPTFMASYTTVDMRDYTNAAGLKVDADNMRAVQLNPNIKWIRNYNNGWQPYLTAGEVWTVGQKSRVRVDGTKLDELHLRPYTEYGLGVQKRWAHDYDGYAEFLGHAGGRRGFLAKLGFRWTFN